MWADHHPKTAAGSIVLQVVDGKGLRVVRVSAREKCLSLWTRTMAMSASVTLEEPETCLRQMRHVDDLGSRASVVSAD